MLSNFENIKFPVYRKYKNDKNYFKIISPDYFEEIQRIGEKKIVFQKEVSILPDRNFIIDLLFNYEDFAIEITGEEYAKILI